MMNSHANVPDVAVTSHGVGPSVLVIDSDPGVRLLLRRELTAAGYCVEGNEPNEGALTRIATLGFDLLMLDIDSPESGGPDSIRIVRELSPVPILALSVHGEEDAIVEALHTGADDYIQKPFRLKELLARTMNALRRRALEQGKPLLVVGGDLKIDLLRRRIYLHDQAVHLAIKSYEVLRVLAECPGQVLTHNQILIAVWGEHRTDRIEYLRHVIQNLRQKLEPDPKHPLYILVERGVGYRLNARTLSRIAAVTVE